MIAVSLNVGGGVRLNEPAKLYMCTQNTTNTRTDARHRCARPWFRTAEPRGERRYENWITTTTVKMPTNVGVLTCMSEKIFMLG